MSVKIALLKSGEQVISDLKELVSDDKMCGYLFNNPHKIEIRSSLLLSEDNSDQNRDLEISLSPWILLSEDKQIPVLPDWIVTIVTPIDTLKEMYEEKINGQNSQVSFTEE